MFNFAPNTPNTQQTAPPRVLALELIARSGARLHLAEHRLVKVKESCARVGIEPPGEVIESYLDVLHRRRPAQASAVR